MMVKNWTNLIFSLGEFNESLYHSKSFEFGAKAERHMERSRDQQKSSKQGGLG